jgi:hypothetical protein
MKVFHSLPFFMLQATLFFPTNISGDTINSEHQHTYKVDRNNPELQPDVSNNIQSHINEDHSNDGELKIILFGNGRALSLDTKALTNTKIIYGNTKQKVKKQMAGKTDKNTLPVNCKSSTNSYRHYSTKKSNATTDTEAQLLPPQKYDCNH